MPASIKHLANKKKVCYNSLLARWTDGLYYAAALTSCDKTKKSCRVCFEDGSEIWVSNRDVHIQLCIDQLSEDEDIVCCICDDGNSEAPNEIILCDVCQQGYHQKCHQPPVDSSKLDASEDTKDHKDWFCATCSYILNQTNRAKLGAGVSQKQQPTKQPQPQPQAKAGPATPQPSKSRGPPPPSVPVVAPKIAATSDSKASIAPRQPPKVKQTPPNQQQQKTNVGPVKPPTATHLRPAPYYPLSNQVRAAAASSSTAALASMTASSALVVGSTAGRSKQDLVKQSDRTSQRQGNDGTVNDTAVSSPPKHAVRKSVVAPFKQSALPTATRSIPSPGMAHNGPSNKITVEPVVAATRSPASIISTQSGTLSVLTSPSKYQPVGQEKSTKQNDPSGPTISAILTSVKDSADDKQSKVEKCARQQTPTPPTPPTASTTTTTTINVISSNDVPAPVVESKVINDSSLSPKVKKPESESAVHSTSEQRHISDSPQLEISFEPSPEDSLSPPVTTNDQDNNLTTNGTVDASKEKGVTTVIVSGSHLR